MPDIVDESHILTAEDMRRLATAAVWASSPQAVEVTYSTAEDVVHFRRQLLNDAITAFHEIDGPAR